MTAKKPSSVFPIDSNGSVQFLKKTRGFLTSPLIFTDICQQCPSVGLYIHVQLRHSYTKPLSPCLSSSSINGPSVLSWHIPFCQPWQEGNRNPMKKAVGPDLSWKPPGPGTTEDECWVGVEKACRPASSTGTQAMSQWISGCLPAALLGIWKSWAHAGGHCPLCSRSDALAFFHTCGGNSK